MSNGSDQASLKRIAREAMLDHGLAPDFSAEALAQAAAVKAAAIESGRGIRDLRALLWASIDNDDSRDLDQLSVAAPQPDGSVRILVAIADVDASVAAGSPIDEHARSNTTSVYTAAGIFPMLPEELSTDLTSLGEDQDRMSVVTEMTVANGRLTQADVYRAVVRNHAKLAYHSVSAWLEGTGPAPARLSDPAMAEQIRIQDKVAQSLRQARREQGALSLQTPEASAVLADGLLVDLRAEEQNRAQELIEDLMVAANGVGARFLQERGLASIRRVLSPPKRWDRIVALAAGVGEKLPAAPDGAALNAFLTRRRNVAPAGFPDLSLSVVKLLGAAQYVLEAPGEQSIGHFGLGLRDYTHSTAPNRRFPDLITQRLLKAALAGKSPPYGPEQLKGLAQHCTAQEANAVKVERQVRKAAAAFLLSSRIGERFEGIVTGASEKGTWVRIKHPMAEGRIIRAYEGADVADRVTVQLLHTDPVRGFIDFARVS